MCSYLLAVIVRDLNHTAQFPEIPADFPQFFDALPAKDRTIDQLNFLNLFERLLAINGDADTYFACLAALHKGRLKYEKILETQPIPTIEQVGPRGLLQYGQLSASGLVGLLFWRKWFYDIDNRAAQETGYVFEPIIAAAIGGAPASAARSPIKRHSNRQKGRQADCIRERRAYEFKMRVTIAASGQGRWREELEFPVDCRDSDFTPVLIVLDATPNPKLAALRAAFEAQNGEVYAGAEAWAHLEEAAGPTMALFLERYIRQPLQSLLANNALPLPNFTAEMGETSISLTIGNETLVIDRTQPEAAPEAEDPIPDDAADALPGV